MAQTKEQKNAKQTRKFDTEKSKGFDKSACTLAAIEALKEEPVAVEGMAAMIFAVRTHEVKRLYYALNGNAEADAKVRATMQRKNAKEIEAAERKMNSMLVTGGWTRPDGKTPNLASLKTYLRGTFVKGKRLFDAHVEDGKLAWRK